MTDERDGAITAKCIYDKHRECFALNCPCRCHNTAAEFPAYLKPTASEAIGELNAAGIGGSGGAGGERCSSIPDLRRVWQAAHVGRSRN